MKNPFALNPNTRVAAQIAGDTDTSQRTDIIDNLKL